MIFPVAEIHLLVWTESDTEALLIYAETCMSTGSLELTGLFSSKYFPSITKLCSLSELMRICSVFKDNLSVQTVCEAEVVGVKFGCLMMGVKKKSYV